MVRLQGTDFTHTTVSGGSSGIPSFPEVSVIYVKIARRSRNFGYNHTHTPLFPQVRVESVREILHWSLRRKDLSYTQRNQNRSTIWTNI